MVNILILVDRVTHKLQLDFWWFDFAHTGTSSKKTSAKKRLVRTAKKLFASTGKAAWIVSTTFLVLVVPLIIETDREQQLVELEQQQMGVLTAKN